MINKQGGGTYNSNQERYNSEKNYVNTETSRRSSQLGIA
jgi:hypothetical protein